MKINNIHLSILLSFALLINGCASTKKSTKGGVIGGASGAAIGAGIGALAGGGRIRN